MFLALAIPSSNILLINAECYQAKDILIEPTPIDILTCVESLIAPYDYRSDLNLNALMLVASMNEPPHHQTSEQFATTPLKP